MEWRKAAGRERERERDDVMNVSSSSSFSASPGKQRESARGGEGSSRGGGVDRAGGWDKESKRDAGVAGGGRRGCGSVEGDSDDERVRGRRGRKK